MKSILSEITKYSIPNRIAKFSFLESMQVRNDPSRWQLYLLQIRRFLIVSFSLLLFQFLVLVHFSHKIIEFDTYLISFSFIFFHDFVQKDNSPCRFIWIFIMFWQSRAVQELLCPLGAMFFDKSF